MKLKKRGTWRTWEYTVFPCSLSGASDCWTYAPVCKCVVSRLHRGDCPLSGPIRYSPAGFLAHCLAKHMHILHVSTLTLGGSRCWISGVAREHSWLPRARREREGEMKREEEERRARRAPSCDRRGLPKIWTFVFKSHYNATLHTPRAHHGSYQINISISSRAHFESSLSLSLSLSLSISLSLSLTETQNPLCVCVCSALSTTIFAVS